jgi:3-hydroxyacyl-CoA dehydrogenase / enoyl-CoA hydratase / 3-hydroxybutyryl-CoA epimerase
MLSPLNFEYSVLNEVQMSAFTCEINKDGIAILSFDLPGEKINKLTTPVMSELDLLLDELTVKSDIKAMVVRSGKEGSFIVGADIAEIRGIADASTGEALARRGQAILNKLEALPFPTVAAIHGPCMGGGMELALACSFRVISNDQRTALALPEVKLGILPGFGGTQRLPRLVGLVNALDMILTGKSIYARKAKQIGLADDVTYKETLLAAAVARARKSASKPIPHTIRAKRPLFTALLESNPLTRQLIFQQAEKNILRETHGNYPAPLAALEAVRYGLRTGMAAGLQNEARLLGTLAPTVVSKNLISVFYLNEMLKKDAHPSPHAISSTGVLGAGVMGGGIAQLFAEKGMTVRIKDIMTRAVGAGLKEAADIFTKRKKKGILTGLQARDGFDRITGTVDYSGFSRVDIGVEAVIENMEVKKTVLAGFEQATKEQAVFASNTSSLSITELAKTSNRPDKVVGMHFFNPVEKMPLVEVVRGRSTSAETIAAITTLSRRIGKLPIVVNDGPGFLVNRILMPYLNESAMMLEEGGTIEAIDHALLQFGMPMGAFILLDEIGIDIAHKVADILHNGLGERVKPSTLLAALYKEGYLGRKNKKGFYVYTGRKRGKPDASLYRLLSAGTSRKESIPPDEIVHRPLLLMIKEAALCLEDKIIGRPDLLDAALIFGIGFPPFRGGLLRYADTIGSKAIVEKLEGFRAKYGERFAPPASLMEMAKNGKRFYPTDNS